MAVLACSGAPEGEPAHDSTPASGSSSPAKNPSHTGGAPTPPASHPKPPATGAPDSGSGSTPESGSTAEAGTSSPPAGPGSTIAAIAQANVGLGACSKNSEGGTAFETSCDGNGGEPEYWCADFAQWVWQEAGVDTTGLDAAAGSFYLYGQTNGTLHTTPALGDAAVFDYTGDGVAVHVAIVVQVNADGSIETVSGDWDGTGSTEAAFASTSQVVLNEPAYPGVTGTSPEVMGLTISAFVSPVASGGGMPSGPPACIVTTGEEGTCIDTSTCASMGGTSTAGFCPGPDDEECCTGL
jgi:hypothetical protein